MWVWKVRPPRLLQVEFTITVRSYGEADIQTDIAKRHTTTADERKRQILVNKDLPDEDGKSFGCHWSRIVF